MDKSRIAIPDSLQARHSYHLWKGFAPHIKGESEQPSIVFASLLARATLIAYKTHVKFKLHDTTVVLLPNHLCKLNLVEARVAYRLWDTTPEAIP